MEQDMHGCIVPSDQVRKCLEPSSLNYKRKPHALAKTKWWRRLACVRCFVCADVLPLHFLILTDNRVPILQYILHDGDIWGLWRQHERRRRRGCRCKLKLGTRKKLMHRVW
nr:uncharacterized protein LOC127348426 isoform X2 [Lolium perenne]